MPASETVNERYFGPGYSPHQLVDDNDAPAHSTHTERIGINQSEPPKCLSDGSVNVSLEDGTELNLEVVSTGKLDGWPIFDMHGTPGSAKGPSLSHIDLYRMGIHRIGISRPGCGDSQPRHEGRTIADCAAYVKAVAQVYGITKASIAGRGGGGPGALACAALLPDLIVNAAVFSCMAPREGMKDWFTGMSEANREAYGATPDKLEKLMANLARVALASQTNIYATFEQDVEPHMSEADRRYLEGHPGIRRQMALGHADCRAEGRYDDIIAAGSPWGFSTKDITRPVFLVHGREDRFSPPSHFWQLCADVRGSGGGAQYEEGFGQFETYKLIAPYFKRLRRQAVELGYTG